MRLFRAEWSRLFARRFTKVMILVMLGILALIGLGVAVSSQQPSPAVAAQAKQLADRQREELRELRGACEEARRNPAEADPRMKDLPSGMNCDRMFDPANVRDEDFLPHSFNFRREAPSFVLVFGGVFAMLAFAVSASFVGAEWSSGGVMNLLTWRPRRVPVLLAKLFALLTGLVTIGMVLSAAWLAALYGIARARGTLGRHTTGSLTSLALDNTRALALALAVGVTGFALASLGRHTATALGIGIGWFLVLEIGLRVVLEIAEVVKPDRWFLSTYAVAWLNKKLELFDDTHCRYTLNEQCEPVRWVVDMGDGALVLGVGVVLVLGAAIVAMSRRDVT